MSENVSSALTKPKFLLAHLVDRLLNRRRVAPPYEVKAETAAIHDKQFIIDLHGDPLLWNRDLLIRSSRGHVDVPRLLEGNIGLQVFGVVTGVPFPIKITGNKDQGDLINLLANLQAWPENTRNSRFCRALFLADKLKRYISNSNSALRLITTKEEVNRLAAEREAGNRVIGCLLSLEGAHALEGSVDNIDRLYEAGFRVFGLSHLFDNDMAGSTHGYQQHGLTIKGKTVVQRAWSYGMIIDLAHGSPRLLDDVLDLVGSPVIASHGGVRGTCDNLRNLEDRHIIGIAKTGGVVGIGLYDFATCGKTMIDTVRAMRYVSDLVGVEHTALGTDFDGAVPAVVDASGLPLLTEALLESGFSEQEVNGIMGGNALRVLRETLK